MPGSTGPVLALHQARQSVNIGLPTSLYSLCTGHVACTHLRRIRAAGAEVQCFPDQYDLLPWMRERASIWLRLHLACAALYFWHSSTVRAHSVTVFPSFCKAA